MTEGDHLVPLGGLAGMLVTPFRVAKTVFETDDDLLCLLLGLPAAALLAPHVTRLALNLGPRMAPGEPIKAPWGSDRWPHYYSTYCIHGQHGDCRLTCKVCRQPCRCDCHEDGA